MAEMRAELRTKTDCASGEAVKRSGSPNSRMARGALKSGMKPPKVVVVARRRGGDVPEEGQGGHFVDGSGW